MSNARRRALALLGTVMLALVVAGGLVSTVRGGQATAHLAQGTTSGPNIPTTSEPKG